MRASIAAGAMLAVWPAISQTLAVLPGAVELSGPEARQQLLAEGTLAERQEDWTREAAWSSSDARIAAVDEHGMVRPVGDGEAHISARARGASAMVTVRVKGSHADFQWSFRNHVIPVMTKMGCNQGRATARWRGKTGSS